MGKQFIRPSWDEYFMEIAHVTKTRSNCIRDPKVGAIIVKDKRIIATGYNGTPHGIKNCFEGGCKRCMDREMNRVKSGEGKEKCICIHAEQNAIIQAAYHGISTKGAIMYATVTSCNNCAKMIINSGITSVYSDEEYTDEDGLRLLEEAKVEVKKIKRAGVVI
jgi:dCMP deaminase